MENFDYRRETAIFRIPISLKLTRLKLMYLSMGLSWVSFIFEGAFNGPGSVPYFSKECTPYCSDTNLPKVSYRSFPIL